ncbi:hypothetical protein [Bacillus wiedmannii]|uniref:hypothetical protein n=1 Tax=Bacillus wiedmannii TaxID=1890302 RepID=UPI000BFE406D|nr:hypothetical protein [Bacillus wiedmannii]PHA62837.1 hypothetical protein COE75_16490 [Bacillus wiedmannii]
MKIRLKENIVQLYIEEHTDWQGNYFGEDHWEIVLGKIAGKTVEVDTEMLFKHEFNTMPIPGVSEEGIRVLEDYVDEVIDDIRHGKARCDLCNSISDSTEVCTHCGKSDYLEPFFEEDEA